MNINEIAKLAGVSRATVSRYLNHGYISEEKKSRIKEIIDETGYKPSMQAQMLRTRKSNLIGVIIPKINSDSIGRMVAGISIGLEQAGYRLLLANTDNHEKLEIQYLKLFADNHVDGIILIGTIFTRAHRKALKELQVPIVILGQELSGYSCVFFDNYHIAYDLTACMIPKGKKFGYIGAPVADQATGEMRKKGFLAALDEAGITIEETCITTSQFTLESGYENMKRILEVQPDTDSVFCATDSIAAGAMRYVKECGMRIPEDIQITGLGDTQLAEVVEPKITTAHLPYKTSGIEAAGMLVDMLNMERVITKEMKLGYEIKINGTTR